MSEVSMAQQVDLGSGPSRAPRARRRPTRVTSRLAAARFAALAGACSALLAGSATGTAAAAGAPSGRTSRLARAERVVDERVIPRYGAVLVTRGGLTLYHYTADEHGKVACTGGCAQLWPPLVLSPHVTRPLGGPGVGGLGVVKDPDGKLQVTYRGEPLYTYVGDHRPGTANGEGLFGKWFVVRVGKPTAATTSKTSGGSGGSGGSSW